MIHKKIELSKEELIKDLFPHLLKIKDEDHIRHFLCWSLYPVDPLGKSENNTIVNLQYKTKKEVYENHLKKKNYDGILVLLDKQTKMDWFIKNHKKIYRDVGDEKYYKMLSEILTYVDNHDLVRKNYSKLISIGKDHLQMMSKKERKQFDKLPDKFTIYRGTSSDNEVTPTNIKDLLGNSWSLEKEISIWFTLKHSPRFRGSKYLIILSYQVDKSEIISYFTERGEKEIFLDYTKIDLSKINYEYIPKNYKVKVSFNKKQSH